MAKKRAIEIILSGKMHGSMNTALNRAQGKLNRYKLMLTGIDNQQKKARASAIGFGGGLMRSIIGFGAAYFGTQQLLGGIKSVTAAYKAQVAEDTRLNTLLMNVKGSTLAQVDSLKKYAGELQKVTTIGDEVTMRGMSQLATFQLQTGSIKKLTPALQDLAVGTYGAKVNQEQMQQSANLLGKVFTGQVGALRRVGVSFSKAQEKVLKMGNEQEKVAMLTKVIAKNYGGLSTNMAKMPEGREIQIANAWGDAQEEIGQRLYPLLTKMLNWLAPRIPAIAAAIMRVVDAVVKLVPEIVKIGNFIIKNWKWIVPIVSGVVGAILAWRAAIAVLTIAQLALNVGMSANPIGLIIIAVGALIGLIVALVLNWKTVVKWLKIAWNWFLKLPGVKNYIELVVAAFSPFVATLRIVWDLVKKVWTKIKGGVGNLFGGKGAASLSRRAMGGPVSMSRSYLVGERGPELFTPSYSGRILPNSSSGINVTFAPVINTSGSASRGEIQAGIDAGYREFKNNFQKLMREQQRKSFV